MNSIEHLKRLIRLELTDCNSEDWPELCGIQSTPAGYRRIESAIIQLALEEAMPVGAAIAQLEQEFTHSKDQR